jgi:predicted ABC-type ATPase
LAEKARPFCLCLAGPNGSGKSTATKGIRQSVYLENWIDPDIVAEGERLKASDLDWKEVSGRAFAIARNLRVEHAQHLRDFGFETVFSHISNIQFLNALKMLGYVVHLYFVCTDNAEINIGRVRNRVREGGHDVPVDKILDRYSRALKNLTRSVRIFDRVVLLDNSFENAPGQAIGQIINGSTTNIQLFPRPHLPSWVLKSALHEPFTRGVPVPEIQTELPDISNPQIRKDLLQAFLFQNASR